MLAAISHSKTTGGAAERRNLMRVLRTGFWGPGPEVARLERELARRLHRRYAVAVQSGSAALHLGLLALGARPGRKVIIPSYTCAAVLNAVEYTGARARVADVEEATGNLDPRAIRGAAAAAIIPHMFGRPARIPRTAIPIIEDCAAGLGGGLGRRGVIVITSFYATKMLGAGQGGAVLTDRPDLARRVRDYIDYDKRSAYRVRYNYRMSDLTAAVARAQLARLAAIVKARRRIADYYCRRLGDLPLTLPRARGHQYYRFVMRVPGTADALMNHLRRNGIESKRPVYRPLHRYLGLRGFPATDRLHRLSVSIPIYPSLTATERRRIVEAVRSFYA